MKIAYLVNGLSKTSIPWRWADFIATKFPPLDIDLISMSNLKTKLFFIKKEVSIVHGHHVKVMFIFLMINVFLKKKTVFTVHGSYVYLSKFNAALLKIIFHRTDKITFVNKMLFDVVPKDLKGIIKDKYKIILNGVELNFNYKKIDVYNKYNINEDDVILFHPARFVTEKNHIQILTALHEIIDNHKNIKLILAGNGRLKSNIIAFIEKFHLEKNVLLLGVIERDEVYNFLDRCNLFLMPSISEGLNISFLEAISMHAKIVVSDIEQFTYPLEVYGLKGDDLNIKFVDPLDSHSIALGISQLLQSGKNNLYDGADFSLEVMMSNYKAVYDSLL